MTLGSPRKGAKRMLMLIDIYYLDQVQLPICSILLHSLYIFQGYVHALMQRDFFVFFEA